MKTTVAIFLMFLFLGVAAAQTATVSPLEGTLIGLEKSVIAAENKKDIAGVRQNVAEDCTVVAVDGRIYAHRDIFDALIYLGAEIAPYNFKVLPLADGVAVVSYDVVVKTAVRDEEEAPLPRYQHFSSVWVNQGGQWKLKFQQATAARVVD